MQKKTSEQSRDIAVDILALNEIYFATDNLSDVRRILVGKGTPVHQALRDLTLSMPHGQVLGIVGANGAGKSTLLKILADVLKQTSGSWVIDGSKLAILEVSSGFTSHLSGRENVRRRLALMGYSKAAIEKLEPDIIDFAELESVIDQTVRTYSKGMRARLAFATVTAPECDVMLLDELLSVGDEYFQGKCLRRIRDICNRGTTAIIVSHDLLMIERLCDRVIWIDHGVMCMDGGAFDSVMAYFGKNSDHYDASLPREYGKILGIDVNGDGDDIVIDISLDRLNVCPNLHIQVVVHDGKNGSLALLANTGLSGFGALPEGTGKISFRVAMQRPAGLSFGIVSVALLRGSSVANFGVVEDAWGWDNNRLIKVNLPEIGHDEAYVSRPLAWQRVVKV